MINYAEEGWLMPEAGGAWDTPMARAAEEPLLRPSFSEGINY